MDTLRLVVKYWSVAGRVLGLLEAAVKASQDRTIDALEERELNHRFWAIVRELADR